MEQLIDTLADKGWVIDTTLFSAQDISAMRAACEQAWQQGQFHEASVGRQDNKARRSEIRSDAVLWLEEQVDHPAIRCYFDKLDQVRQAVNQAFYMGLADVESHFAVYPPGAFYKKHLDRFRDDDARTLTAVLYLNESWPSEAGGQLRLYLDSECTEFIDVEPQAGTLVLFLSDRFWHEVLPAHAQRLSITGWFRRQIGTVAW